MKRQSALFALAMGILMIIAWAVYIAAGQLDSNTPLESASLLAAEAVTALCLIAGGMAVLAGKAWGTAIHIASMGMMLYTAIYSIGVFAQTGVIAASIFFAALTLVTIIVLLRWAGLSPQEREPRISVFHRP